MSLEEQNLWSRMRFWFVTIMLVTVIFGTIGGGILGGIAGYMIALKQQPVQATLPQPSTVSMPANKAPALVPTLSPPEIPVDGSRVTAENDALINAVERVKPATVTIFTASSRGAGSGSGVIIDPAGYIITNHHVVADARRLEVVLSHGGSVPAQLVGSTDEFDLAILKIDAKYVPAVAVFGDSSALKQGERVAAIGSALGDFRNTVTSGVLSAHNRSLGFQRGLLQTDTAINHGNSGGPLINLDGEIIGINVMVLRSTISGDLSEGLGFAIPSNTARMVAKQLIETGEVAVPFLGVRSRDLNPQLSMEYRLSVVSGALIDEVIRGTAAEQVGLRPGDVILAVDGQTVDDAHPLGQLLLQHNVGQDVELTIVRGAEQMNVTVALGIRPGSN